MACQPFTVPFSGNAETLFNQAADLIRQYNGKLEGTPEHSTFSISVPFFGNVSGDFTLTTTHCTVTITEHSIFLPCKMIQQFIHSAINKRAI
jgi:hypothetical protein